MQVRALAGLTALLGIVAIGCSGSAESTSVEPGEQSDSDIPREVGQVNRIVYVSPSGDLFTVNPDGTDLSQLTGGFQAENGPAGEGSHGQGSQQEPSQAQGSQGGVQAQPLRLNEYYTWPTWSADGTKLAASRVVVGEDKTEITIQVMDARTGRSETVYKNEQAGLVADGAPHYIYWAPSGESLSFLVSTPGGLSLFVWDGTPGKPADLVDRGAPLYFHWTKDGAAMALHVGSDLALARPPVGDSARPTVQSSVGFRVPAVSPDGASVAYVVDAGGRLGLHVASMEDLSQTRKIMDVGALSAFSWSPDGTQLAVADQRNPRNPLFERLMLVPVGDGPLTTLTTEQVLAFYWAPAGDKLAWVALNSEAQEMEWVISPSDGSDAKRLFSFQPSSESFIMLSFFDQYAYSHSPWSPDGKSLVMAGSKGAAARASNGRTPTGDRIYVLDVEGGTAPRDLGAGVLAFWSWN